MKKFFWRTVGAFEFKYIFTTHTQAMKLVIVDGTPHERVDCRVWDLADAKGAMALLLTGQHLAVIQSGETGCLRA